MCDVAAGFIGRLGRQGFKQHTGFTYMYMYKRWILNDLSFWGCLPLFLLETKGYKTRQNIEINLFFAGLDLILGDWGVVVDKKDGGRIPETIDLSWACVVSPRQYFCVLMIIFTC